VTPFERLDSAIRPEEDSKSGGSWCAIMNMTVVAIDALKKTL